MSRPTALKGISAGEHRPLLGAGVGRATACWRAVGTASAVSIATLIPGLGLVGMAAAPAHAADPACTTSGLTTTCTFSYTGASQPVLLPDYVSLATFEVVGAAGGRGTDGVGGVAGVAGAVAPCASAKVGQPDAGRPAATAAGPRPAAARVPEARAQNSCAVGLRCASGG